MVEADAGRDHDHGQVMTEVEVVRVVQSRMGAEDLLQKRVEHPDSTAEDGKDTAEKGGPDVELAAERLTVGGPWRRAPVRDPHAGADDQQRDPQADRVSPIVRLDADDRRLELLGQRPQQTAHADRPHDEGDQRRQVRVQAPHARLPVGLLRSCIPRQAAADQEPGHSPHEEKRAGRSQGCQHVGPGAAGVADAEKTRQAVVEDLARAEQGVHHRIGHGDESREGAQRRVAVVRQVTQGDRPRVEAPEDRAGDCRTGGKREG